MDSTEKTENVRNCPTCGDDAAARGEKGFPFCSTRCQLADLGRWLNEDYKIPDDTTQ